jgi:hypothetical protein
MNETVEKIRTTLKRLAVAVAKRRLTHNRMRRISKKTARKINQRRVLLKNRNSSHFLAIECVRFARFFR